jgi:hypothetical protein
MFQGNEEHPEDDLPLGASATTPGAVEDIVFIFENQYLKLDVLVRLYCS